MPAYNYYPNYAAGWGAYMPYQPQQVSMAAPQNPQYMIQVDGEIGAKAWQPQGALPPNTVIPLWDFDGQHVYFKSTDAYGRMNPVRKGRVVFEEEQQTLAQGTSGAAEPEGRFVTKEDLNSLRDEMKQMFSQMSAMSQNNQNGRGNRG